MIANPQNLPKMTVAAYLEWEPQQELRHEYIDGKILAMTDGSIPHNDIALNLYRALYPHLQQKGCRINVSDVKVQAQVDRQYFYPDLVVTCHPEDLKARNFIQNPKMIIEVISPGTGNDDRTQKLQPNYSRSFVRNLLAAAELQERRIKEIEQNLKLPAYENQLQDIRYYLHLPQITYMLARLPKDAFKDDDFRKSIKHP